MDEKISCITVQEMGKALSLSKSAAYNLANRPDFFPAFKIGTRILINRAKLEEWISKALDGKVGT